MKRSLLILPTLALISVVVFGLIWSSTASASEEKRPRLLRPVNQQQVQHGWRVCVIGEVGAIPEVGKRQMFELCHADGWRISTYCLIPGRPAPEPGAYCSQTSPGVFWCGDKVQELKQLSVLQTPAPKDTAIPTIEPIPTSAPIPTSVPTIVSSLIPLQAPSTLTKSHPQPRGPGVLVIGLLVLWGIMLAAAAGWVYRHWNDAPLPWRRY